VSTLAGFGLLLAIAWLPTFSANTAYKATTTVLAAAVGFLIGGYIAGRGGRPQTGSPRRPLWVSVGSVRLRLRPRPVGWYALIAGGLAGLLGALGGWLVRRSTWAQKA